MSSETDPVVLVERNGPVTTVVINRPDRRNAVNHDVARSLRAAFSEFDRDREALVAVLTGAGSSFCAGGDLDMIAEGTLPYHAEDDGPLGPTRMLLSKPVIAAVEGHAVAGGLELALWCDLRVVSRTAVFGVFCRRWGVPLVDGGTVRLPRLIGHSRALDLILTGRPVDAEEAMAFGLANRLVEPGEARSKAEELALDISRFPQLCMNADRMSSYLQWGMPLADALRSEGVGGLPALRQEAPQGAARFAGGRGRGGDQTEI